MPGSFLKAVVLYALLFSACLIMSVVFTTTSKQDFIVYGVALLALIVLIYSPPFTRWWRKKG